ncbi:MAG: cobalt ECF transporter T component CbiQ [Caldilineae bacterium]|nr:MAG: cobalt ECF transporter T component CbiQ [Caldilineae bacterium]
MHSNVFDRYRQAESFVHRLDPRLKVVLTALFILSNLLLPDGAWWGFAASFVLLMAGSLLAQLSPWLVLRRSFIAVPFALAAVTTTFATPGPPALVLHFGDMVLSLTRPGLVRFLSIVIRSLLSVQMAILLTSTTSFPDLIHALRHLRLPSTLVAIISFMYRYLFLLSDEAMRLLRARAARSARLPSARAGGSVGWRARVAGNMAGQLFVRSFERSDRVYNAMLARGYDGHLYTLNPHAMKGRDWMTLALFLLILLALQTLSRLV